MKLRSSEGFQLSKVEFDPRATITMILSWRVHIILEISIRDVNNYPDSRQIKAVKVCF